MNLAEKSTTINYIYNLGYEINLKPLSGIIAKIDEIANNILLFGQINTNQEQENVNKQKEILIKNLDTFLFSINMSHTYVENQFLNVVQNDIENKLNSISSTPINFDLSKIYQEIISYYFDNIDTSDKKNC
ncbi:hypothetical protein [Arsenophonus sp.]|uniref:hypothetical protein n=1 Tax=Arsenophonus sp. TaxID=1872640 RepID=UPI0028558F12|nr:hypothetical protein [Arsenophonus sp.]MDR5617120.1 hypothetical protein [Arsenophonus sp.]